MMWAKQLLHRRTRAWIGFAWAVGVAGTQSAIGNDLLPLSDEFDNAATHANWLRIHEVEQWNADQLEHYDIHESQPGQMVMMPYTATWFQDWRGPLSFKSITGDFVVTTEVTSTGRDGTSVPGGEYSLAGLMMRSPRNVTPATWSPGGENFVFFSLGQGNNGGTAHQFEVKTTINSASTLILSPAPGATARLQLARLGEFVIALRQVPGQPWQVHRRYHRADFPAELQVGPVAYTDWFKVQVFPPFVHNSNVLTPPLPPGVVDPDPKRPFAPDLLARFEFVRFFRPTLPPNLQGLDLTNQAHVPDAALLSFLGEQANIPNPIPALYAPASALLAILLAVVASFVYWPRTSGSRRGIGVET